MDLAFQLNTYYSQVLVLSITLLDWTTVAQTTAKLVELYNSQLSCHPFLPFFSNSHTLSDELHLTPLHAIVQLKSSLSHLDRADSGAKKAAAAVESGGDVGGDTTGSEGEEAKPVVVKFARRENKVKSQQKGIGRKKTFQETREERETSEAWVAVKYNGAESEEAAEERRLLFADRDDQREVFSQATRSYVNAVCPMAVTHEATPTVAMPTGVLSLADLKSLPLSQQVVKLLRNAHMIQFSRLCSMLGVAGGGVTSVCEAVRGCAVLVQGCWVVSSQQIFPGEENSTKRNTRDYIVSWSFAHLPVKLVLTSVLFLSLAVVFHTASLHPT